VISAGADKAVVYRSVTPDFEITQYHKEVFKNNKVVAMSQQDTKVITGHDKFITVTDLSYKCRVFEKKPEKIKLQGSQDFSFVQLDLSGTFALTASTDKMVSIFDLLNGNLVSKCSVGENTTAMTISHDCSHLITTSADGCIYFWRLHESF
jgi:WD40 repeat protein